MSDQYKDIITIGKKKGEWDFCVRATIQELSNEEMDKLRAMIVVAIGTTEDMWRRGIDRRSGMAAKQDSTILDTVLKDAGLKE